MIDGSGGRGSNESVPIGNHRWGQGFSGVSSACSVSDLIIKSVFDQPILHLTLDGIKQGNDDMSSRCFHEPTVNMM
jgi:hypothetical protein